MIFESMKQRLIELVRERVANGEITESQLARQTGISQPHIHNVLKGVKVLQTELADEIFVQLRMKAEDLLPAAANGSEGWSSAPLLMGSVGMGMVEFCPHRTCGGVPVPKHLMAVTGSPLAVRLGNDTAMEPHFSAGDILLVDTADRRHSVCAEGIYIVMTTRGPRLRHLKRSDSRLYFSGANARNLPSTWECVSSDGAPAEKVRGRAVWLSRLIAPEYEE